MLSDGRFRSLLERHDQAHDPRRVDWSSGMPRGYRFEDVYPDMVPGHGRRFLPVAEAAGVMGCTTGELVELIRMGAILARSVGGELYAEPAIVVGLSVQAAATVQAAAADYPGTRDDDDPVVVFAGGAT